MTKLHNLTRESRKPNEVYDGMIRLSKSAIRLQKAYYRLDLLTELVKQDIPVNNAAVICKKACIGLRNDATLRQTTEGVQISKTPDHNTSPQSVQ